MNLTAKQVIAKLKMQRQCSTSLSIATTIVAVASLNINDDNKQIVAHEIGSLIAECASNWSNYSSATDVLAQLTFQHHCDQISALFEDQCPITGLFRA